MGIHEYLIDKYDYLWYLYYYHLIKQSRSMSEDKIILVQERKMRRIINYAYNNIPFYKTLWDSIGVDPQSIKKIKDLSKLPIISKEDVRKNMKSMLNPRLSRKQIVERRTSGTTGKPLRIFFRPHELRFEIARLRQQYAGWDIDFDGPAIYLQRYPSLSSINWKWIYKHSKERPNVTWLNALMLDSVNADKIIKKLERSEVCYLRSVPHFLIALLKEVNKRALKIKINNIVSCSEILTEGLKKQLIKIFKANVFDYYTNIERSVCAWECPKGGHYHVEPFQGILEVLDQNNVPTIMGRAITTSLFNYTMPLIRYDTEDIVTRGKNCNCGINLPVLKSIDGRLANLLITKSGKIVPPRLLFYPFPYKFLYLQEIRCVHNKIGKFNLEVVVPDAFKKKFLKSATRKLKNLFGDDMEFRIIFKKKIYTPSVQKQDLVSKVFKKQYKPFLK